jgi:hypothetical protein
VFENRVLRRTFGPISDRKMKFVLFLLLGYSGHGEVRNAFKILVRKPEGKGPFG